MAKSPRKRFCFVYRTTNLTNGKYYIGCHCTFKLDDGYLGSGTKLQRAVIKYGRENFRLEILQFFETREAALAREKELVTEELLKDPMCMNIQLGGEGGWTDEARNQSRWLWNNDPEWRARLSLKLKRALKSRYERNPNDGFLGCWKGKAHNESSIEKIRASKMGSSNPNFGTCWVWKDGEGSRRIQIDELDLYLQKGWLKKRKIK